jgi:hypothetical protein
VVAPFVDSFRRKEARQGGGAPKLTEDGTSP